MAELDKMQPGNQAAGRSLLRMKIAWKGQEYSFSVNPEDYTQSEPNKATVTQTKGGAWIDAWGEGIKEITIKGTTGWRGHGSDQDLGFRRWKELRDLIQSVYDDVQDGQKVELMEFCNYTDAEFFYVYPAQGGIELFRNKARPYIYQYTLHLWAVRRRDQPEVEHQVLGDPVKSERQRRAEAEKGLESAVQDVLNGNANISTVTAYIRNNLDYLGIA